MKKYLASFLGSGMAEAGTSAYAKPTHVSALRQQGYLKAKYVVVLVIPYGYLKVLSKIL